MLAFIILQVTSKFNVNLSRIQHCFDISNEAGNKERARGFLFFTWTGVLCLPLTVPFLAVLPYVYFCDPNIRMPLAEIMNWWAQTTTKPFFVPRIEGIENLPPLDQPVVYIANHQVVDH